MDNVVDIGKNRPNPIFNGSFRQRVENGIRPQTEKPEEVVRTIENMICAEIVTVVRVFVTRLFSKAGDSFGGKAGKKLI